MYARAVRVESGRETEGTVPNNWIDINKKTVRWPNTRVKEAYKMKKDPQDDWWLMFQLIKRKMTSGKFKEWFEIVFTTLLVCLIQLLQCLLHNCMWLLGNIRDCENYNLTSQAEEEEEEEEVVFGGKRKRAKKTFDDYVVGMFLTE